MIPVYAGGTLRLENEDHDCGLLEEKCVVCEINVNYYNNATLLL